MQDEKAPLLEAHPELLESQPESLEAQPESTLEELQQQVTDAKQTWNDARQQWIDANRAYHAAWQKTRNGKIATWIGKIAATVLGSIAVAMVAMLVGAFVYMAWDQYANGDEEYLPRRVPLEAHIMSKCPDARDCLHDLILPAMQNVSHMVDFKLSYIGTNTDDDDGVSCMHGAPECLGNTIELCAAHMYRDPKIYLGFTMCMSKDFADIPQEQLIKDCALEHGISFDRLNNCISRDDGSMGLDLLRSSVNRSIDAGVTKSCTVRLDGKVRCIRDGGKWTDCEGGHEVKDLVEDVMELRLQHSPELQMVHTN